MAKWSLGYFLLLVVLVLTLFLSAALILPPADIEQGESLRKYFEDDGRWALPMLAGYSGAAILADWVFWGEAPWSLEGALNAALLVLPLIAFVGTRRVQVAATALYAPLVICAIAWLSPATY